MPESRESFQYALLRVVPSEPRGERLNVGVVVFSRRLKYLAAASHVDSGRLRALDPSLDVEAIAEHLHGIERIAAGAHDGGPIAKLDQSERFHWLVAPASTVVQPSPVHTGLCDDPQKMLDHLMETLVRTPA